MTAVIPETSPETPEAREAARAWAHEMLELPVDEACDHGSEGRRKCDRLTAARLEHLARVSALEARLVEVTKALEEAATSLETASRWKREEGEATLDVFYALRGYANSRATVARASLAGKDYDNKGDQR